METQERFNGRRVCLVCILMIVVLGPAPAAAEERSCSSQDPALIYMTMRTETMSLSSYTAEFYHETVSGDKREIWSKATLSGKYVREPLVTWEKRHTMEASFPEQAGPGYQEIYDGRDRLTRIIMPGALKAIGVITMYPEDPKADYINGENSKDSTVWNWIEGWDAMREGGRMELDCAEYKGKQHYVLTIHRSEPDPVYRHVRQKLWIDRTTWFPMRIEIFRQGDPKPVVVHQFEQVNLKPGLKADDIDFEGLRLGWNLAGVSIPKGDKLNTLKQVEPRLTGAGLDAAGFVAALDNALSGLKDYRTEITLELRYYRLRLYKVEQLTYIKDGGAFSFLNKDLQANYILLNAGSGFRAVYDPKKDKLLHIIPSGVYRVMGEQSFPLDDPRVFSSLGDSPLGLTFPAIRDKLGRMLKDPAEVRMATATQGGASGPWIEVREKGAPVPKRPSVIRLMLDNKTLLPAVLEYRGYDDKEAYVKASFNNTVINRGLTNEQLWK